MNISVCSGQVKSREELIDKIFARIHSLSNAIDEQSRKIEKMTGLSKSQTLTIKTISGFAKPVKVSELARSMYLNPATMVRILDELEEQKIVTRTRSKEDRRVVEIGLTKKAGDIELILNNITYRSVTHSLDAMDFGELLNILDTLQRLSPILSVPCLNISSLQDADS